jgi:hypothetical protein
LEKFELLLKEELRGADDELKLEEEEEEGALAEKDLDSGRSSKSVF